MNAPFPGSRPDRPPKPSWRRARLAGFAAGVAALAAGAFLLRGPGSGQVNATAGRVTMGTIDPSGVPEGFIIAVPPGFGHARAVIDGVDLIGGTRYDGPHALALGVLASPMRCNGPWPAWQTRTGFAWSCPADRPSETLGPLIGHAFGPQPPPYWWGYPAAVEVSPPRPGTCWVLTRVVVRYHVGSRHYTSSTPYRLAVCASQDQLSAAVAAAAAS